MLKRVIKLFDRFGEFEKILMLTPKNKKQESLQVELKKHIYWVEVLYIVSFGLLIGAYFSIASFFITYLPFSQYIFRFLVSGFGWVGTPTFFILYYLASVRRDVHYTKIILICCEFITEEKAIDKKEKKKK